MLDANPTASTATFASVLSKSGGQGRGFDTLRLVAATAVFLAHAPWLTNRQFDFVYQFSSGQTFSGSMAVGCFFIMSGFLVTASYENSSTAVAYAIKRVLRIFPGLIIAVAFATFIIGALATTLPLTSYFSDKHTYAYLGNIFFRWRAELPGVFATNPRPYVNVSLWTLYYEVLCYGAIPTLALVGVTSRRYAFSAMTAVLVLLGYLAEGNDRVYLISTLQISITPALHLEIGPFIRLAAYFFMGAALHGWADRVPYDWRLALVALVGCIAGLYFGFNDLSFPIFGAYLLIFLGISKLAGLEVLHGNDLSYGVYIYACPIQQLMISFFPAATWWANALLSVPGIFCCAAFSWHFVERPALRFKRHLSTKSEMKSVPCECETSSAFP
jgi:peptidoglycan/LPS O-acetylase OafA/YrhL